jgi:hypothetical protein
MGRVNIAFLKAAFVAFVVLLLIQSGCSDPAVEENYELLTVQKHRTEVPEEYAIQDVSLDTAVHWSGTRAMPISGLRRERWSAEDRGYVMMQEWHSVRVTAYLLQANNEPDGDMHLSLGDSANSDLSTSMVVEMTPYYRQIRSWQLYNIQKYLHQQVRITGWLLWDEEHSAGPDRASVWEIHPVFRFEVFDNGAWQELK